MKKKIPLISLGMLLLVLTGFAQKTTLNIPIKAYVDLKTANYFGGKAAIQDSINKQFQRVNQFYNAETRFNNIYNFYVSSFQFYTDNEASDSTHYYSDNLITSYLKIVYDNFVPADRKGYNAYLQTILFSHNGDSGNAGHMFGRIPTRGLAHELGHSRSAIDLYAGNVDGSKNLVVSNLGFRTPYPSIMNNLYEESVWDTQSIYLMNQTASTYGVGPFTDAQHWAIQRSPFPQNIVVRVKDAAGNAVANANVKFYGVIWYFNDHATSLSNLDKVVDTPTDANGLLTYSGTNANPFNPSVTNGATEYFSFLVAVTANGQTRYSWLTIYDVQNTFISGSSTHYHDVVVKTSTIAAPNQAPYADLITTTDGQVRTYPSDIWVVTNADDLDGSINSVSIYDGTSLLGYANYEPDRFRYAYQLLSLSVGTHSIKAVATDNQGATTQTLPLLVNILPTAPTVALTSPVDNSVVTAGSPVTLNASVSAGSGTITKVEFYNGLTKLGEDVTSPYSINWTPSSSGKTQISARVYDNQGMQACANAINITVNPAALPSPWVQSDIGSVGLAGSASYSNGTFTSQGAGADIWGTSDGLHYIYQQINGNVEIVAKVNSMTNSDGWAKAGVMIRESLNANSTHAMIVTTPSNGIAFQNRTTTGAQSNNTSVAGNAPVWLKINRTGNTFTTSKSTDGTTWTTVGSVSITMAANAYVGLAVTAHTTSTLCTAVFSQVSVSTSSLPVVNITSPSNNAVILPGSVTINATATEAGGTISKVEFYNGSTLLGTSTASPYSYTWTNVSAGTYSLTAKAYDNANVTAISSPVSITVDHAPTVSITAPATGAVYQAPGTINLTVNAADTDGTISKVEYYKSGTTLIGTSTTSPFSLTWSSVAAGTYSVTAKAYDNYNAATTSSAISIKVNAAPTISISSPTTGTTYNNPPATVAITANAADSDGSISKVEFYSNGSLIGTVTSSPFNYSWTNVAAGTYSLTAKATDNNGGITTSSAVSITVSSGNNVCANIPQYSTSATYVDGSQVQNVGNYYQCKPYPYTGWCNISAYEPGTTAYWQDAWILLGSCSAKMGATKEVMSMDFYPNPAQSSVNLNFTSVSEGYANITITDMYSKQVMATELNVVSGNNSVALNVSDVMNGIYMVTIIKGNDTIVKQLVISK